MLSLRAPSCPMCRRDLTPYLPFITARLPSLRDSVRRRLFDAEDGRGTFLVARSTTWLGHTRRSPLVAPSERNAVTPSSPPSEEEAAPDGFVP